MVKFDDAGGADLWFRQFISVQFLDGSKRYVSQAQCKEDLLKRIWVTYATKVSAGD